MFDHIETRGASERQDAKLVHNSVRSAGQTVLDLENLIYMLSSRDAKIMSKGKVF